MEKKEKKSAWVLPLDWHLDLYKNEDRKEDAKRAVEAVSRKTYSQDWELYNNQQTLEMLHINDYMQYFLDKLPPEIENGNGRPKASLKDIILIGINIQYMSMSTRRVYSHTEFLDKSGYISRPYHFNTISKYIRDKSLTPMLESLIGETSRPLAIYENMLTIDATGIGKHFFSHWVEDRQNFGEGQRDYLKLHAIVGAKTGTILSAIVTSPNVGDSTQFQKLLLNAHKIVDITRVAADRAYLSRKNIDFTYELGGIPFIPFKSSCTNKRRGSDHWKKMYDFFHNYNDVFMQQYHLRSNVESVFSTIKRVTPKKLMTGSFTSQKNEVLLKCLTHNLRVLSRENIIMESVVNHFEKGKISA